LTDPGPTDNLLIDDVLFALVGAVGTRGWGTHTEHIGSPSNQVLSVDWANTSSAWDGYYCARLNARSDGSDAVYIAPLPEPGGSGGEEFASGGFQIFPTPQMNLRVGVRVRMSPGIATAAGVVSVEYRSHAGDGHENQFQSSGEVTIPNDGNWHFVYEDISVTGDTVIAIGQLAMWSSDWYDVDGWTARDVAANDGADPSTGLAPSATAAAIDPATTGYLRGTTFEATLDVENASVIAAGLSTLAQGAIAAYGRRDQVVSNENIVALNGQAFSWVAAWLNQFAVLLGRTRVDLADEQVQQPNPGTASLVRVSGSGNDIADQYATRTAYTWSGKLAVSLELTTQRPTLDKLLLTAALANSSSGASSTGAALAASSSGSPSGGGSSPPLTMQVDSFAVAGLGPYGLTQTPDGKVCIVATDAGVEGFGLGGSTSSYSVSTATPSFVFNAGFAVGEVSKLTVYYSYNPISESG
jgi:hypothetical protein